MKKHNLTVTIGLMAGMLALAACGAQQPGEELHVDAAELNSAAAPTTQSADHEGVGPLVCDDGTTIQAKYREDIGPDGGIVLDIDGEQYVLNQVPSASGSKYSTEQGITPDMLLVYWEKGNQAMLLESPLDDSAGPDDEKIRARCKPVEGT